MESIVNLSDSKLHFACLAIILAPTIWNILARIEYYTHLLTKVALNNPYYGCYALTAWIFCFSAYRDYLFTQAIDAQPKLAVLDNSIVMLVGYILMVAGSVFVVTSMYQLGVTGTYLGDYFGILMDNMVTSFPFNVMNNPMYDGATLIFLGQSLVKQSAAGLLMTVLVFVCYRIALLFEEPFTHYIYAQRAKNQAQKPTTPKRTKKDE